MNGVSKGIEVLGDIKELYDDYKNQGYSTIGSIGGAVKSNALNYGKKYCNR